MYISTYAFSFPQNLLLPILMAADAVYRVLMSTR